MAFENSNNLEKLDNPEQKIDQVKPKVDAAQHYNQMKNSIANIHSTEKGDEMITHDAEKSSIKLATINALQGRYEIGSHGISLPATLVSKTEKGPDGHDYSHSTLVLQSAYSAQAKTLAFPYNQDSFKIVDAINNLIATYPQGLLVQNNFDQLKGRDRGKIVEFVKNAAEHKASLQRPESSLSKTENDVNSPAGAPSTNPGDSVDSAAPGMPDTTPSDGPNTAPGMSDATPSDGPEHADGTTSEGNHEREEVKN